MAQIAQGQKIKNDKKDFTLIMHSAGKDSSFNFQALGLQTGFDNETEAMNYVNRIPGLFLSKGFPTASVDSFWKEENAIHVLIYTGRQYSWVHLKTNVDKGALNAAGYNEKNYLDKPVNFSQVQQLQQRLLNYYENNGYPFATVYLDSIIIRDDKMDAILRADKGVLYHIDSIRLYGKVNLNKHFLQRYLSILNGSIYSKEKLQLVDVKMLELPFLKPVQQSDITMLGSGSVLNLYVEPRRSSQVNFLVGFLPAASGSDQKLQVTGDIHLDLKNLLGGAEEILVKWQQLQPKSPRLNLGYTKPYIFKSPFGFNFLFDLFKKDSNFLQINAQAGVQYYLSGNQWGKLFVQWQNNTLLSGAVDTNMIKLQKELPPNVDVSSVNTGINYEWLATNYRFNPRKGNEVNVATAIGIKNIRKNADITNIKDPSFDYNSLYDSIETKNYQLRVKFSGAHYFPLAKSATLKTTLSGGHYASPSVFRNELFQIGGYRLLRGFNEESIYASSYAVFSAEYRYLVGLNSYLFAFTDMGFVKNKYQSVNTNNQFLGAGLGILFETKAGLLNVSYAMGKRDDVKFNLREASKLHFGYINYF